MKCKISYVGLILALLLAMLSGIAIAQDVDNDTLPIQMSVFPTPEPGSLDSSSGFGEPEVFTGTLGLPPRFDQPVTVYSSEQIASLRQRLTAVVTQTLTGLSSPGYAVSEGASVPPDMHLLALDFDGNTLTLDLSQAARGLGESAFGELLQIRLVSTITS
jgi:hypothetical protein